jgi:hypothetical protein
MKRISTILYFISHFFFSCNNINVAGDDFSLKELKRIISSDKKVEAVLVETNGGATSSLDNLVFIVIPGKKITQADTKYSVFNADHYQNVDIKWEKNNELLISYSKARIFNYTNFWQTQEIDNWNYVVEIKLHCLSPDGQLSESEMHPMTH